MPLLKKTAFALLEPPKDLKPNEVVYQIRFTKEIFRDYQMYLNRLNMYRQRIWSCKITGKVNLTFEEALVSEKNALEKVQAIPEEVVAPALRIIQYSMLSLKDLADSIATKLQEDLFVGAVLHGKKDGALCPCRILKILIEDSVGTRYEVEWIDETNKSVETSVLNREDLMWKKIPFSRRMLKPFIRDSTYRSAPWALQLKLAEKHGISCDLPPELKGKVFIKDGLVVCLKKRKDIEDQKNAGEVEKPSKKQKMKKVGGQEFEAADTEGNKDSQPREDPIKYPIDDLLVQPGADDPVFTIRPSPLRDFHIPMDGVGDLLMVWDFCSSFGRMLNLLPFSLEDLENAICHKDSNLNLLVETHSALLRLLIKDNGQYFSALQEKNRKMKITLITWTDYLCDFLEMINFVGLSPHSSTIKRGYYGLLDPHIKLRMLRELVNHVLEIDLFREKLDEHIEQRQLLGATRRGEALEEGRKRREEKGEFKVEDVDRIKKENSMEIVGNNPKVLANVGHLWENGNNAMKKNKFVQPLENHASDKRFEGATREGELLEGDRKRSEGKEIPKAETFGSVTNGFSIESTRKDSKVLVNDNHIKENADAAQKRNGEAASAPKSHASNKREISNSDLASKKMMQNGDVEILGEHTKSSSGKAGLKQLKNECKQGLEMRSKEERDKYYEREIEKRILRASPLGKDRDYNWYWWFRRDGRIFIESSDSKLWGYYSSKEELDALMGSLNCKGEREKALHDQLGKLYSRICYEIQKRTKDLTEKIALEEAVLRRSTRVRAMPRENPANSFLGYVNKWKDD